MAVKKETEASIETMSIFEKLARIQIEVKAPKNANGVMEKSGKPRYMYRKLEDIIEASKAICTKYRTTIVLNDEPTVIDGWHYIRATATLFDWDSEQSIEVTNSTREAQAHPGMDIPQVTGTSVTYARKNCLTGLLGLDNSDNDPDNPEVQTRAENRARKEKEQASAASKEESGANLKTLTNTRIEISKLGVDVHSENFEAYIRKHTGFQNVDPAVICFDNKATGTLLAVYEQIIKAKQNTAKMASEMSTIDITDKSDTF